MNFLRNGKFVEIKEFLEDIYIYLNNTLVEHEKAEKAEQHEKTRQELIRKCKHIRNLFENEFNPLGDDFVDASYLAMDGNGSAKQEEQRESSNISYKTIATQSEDTVSVSITETENIYDNCNINQTKESTTIIDSVLSTSLTKLEKEKFSCPFSGLPAAHLKIMMAPKHGTLHRIEKKIFFGQSKSYYAGLLECWLILYTSATEIKPTQCLLMQSVQIDTMFDSNGKKRENLFHVTSSGKKYQFQAISTGDMNEWISVIKQSIQKNENTDRLLHTDITKQKDKSNGSRKLPTPPPQSPRLSKSYYVNQRISAKSISSNEEMIYEEPSAMNESTDKASQDNCYDTYDTVAFSRESTPAPNSISPPNLPLKVGKKSIDVNIKHDYDVPKSSKQPETDVFDLVTTPQKMSEIVGVRVSEVKAILSSQKIHTSPIRLEDKKPIKIAVREKVSPTKEHRTPVKSWFMKHINKGEKSRKSGSFLTKLSKTSEHVQAPDGSSSCESISKPIKGGKVNMIISQLEANGHLHLLSKSLMDRKSMIVDPEEYETVTIKDSKIHK